MTDLEKEIYELYRLSARLNLCMSVTKMKKRDIILLFDEIKKQLDKLYSICK